MATTAITNNGINTGDVRKASVELRKMRRSLEGWLRYRALNDAVAAGKVQSKYPAGKAAEIVYSTRDWETEEKLASRLHTLLSEVMPDANLPSPNIDDNPNAAVQLAQIAISGSTELAQPQAQGMPWLWPVVIVGGLLLVLTTAIKTYADVAKEKERLACVKAGACTDYGFWLKAAAVVFLAWFAWEKMGVGDKVNKMLKGR